MRLVPPVRSLVRHGANGESSLRRRKCNDIRIPDDAVRLFSRCPSSFQLQRGVGDGGGGGSRFQSIHHHRRRDEEHTRHLLRATSAAACRCHATIPPIRGDGGGGGGGDGKVRDATIPNNGDVDDDEDYAAAVISSDRHGNTEVQSRRMSIQQIINEVPGTHPRDFFSLSLTSLGDASRKRRAMRANHYSIKNTMHPWFIVPRGSEIIVSCGAVRTGAYNICPKSRRNLYRILLTHMHTHLPKYFDGVSCLFQNRTVLTDGLRMHARPHHEGIGIHIRRAQADDQGEDAVDL